MSEDFATKTAKSTGEIVYRWVVPNGVNKFKENNEDDSDMIAPLTA